MFLAEFLISFGILLNISLCVDLVLMVRYPFESKDGRVNRYLIISFVLSLIPAITLTAAKTGEDYFQIYNLTQAALAIVLG